MYFGNFFFKSFSIIVLFVIGWMRVVEEIEVRFVGFRSLVVLLDFLFFSVRLDLDKKFSILGCVDLGVFFLFMNKDKFS